MRGSSAATPTFARTFFQHVGISVVVLAAVASVAVLVTVRTGREALRQPVAGGEAVASRIVAPLVTQGVYDGNIGALRALDDRVQLRKAASTIERIKVWSEDGVILYSDDPRQIGLRYPLDPDRSRALTSQQVESTVTELTQPDNLLDRQFGRSIEVSAGTRDTSGRPILVQTYYTVDQLNADEATLTRRLVALVLVSLLAFGLLFVPLAYSLARRATRVNGDSRTRPAGPGTP